MKKSRVATIVTISVALVLISSVTYAAGKKKQAKLKVQAPDAISEEEALRAELLAATEEEPIKRSEMPANKVAEERADTKEDQLEG